jgi:hypothetical protein
MVPYPFYNPNQPAGMNANVQDSMNDPRGYGVTNQMPQSMNPQPSSLPVTYQDRQSLFGMRPTYAHGGSVKPLMQQIQSMGQRGDTILAHINPQEALELSRNHGGDINPQTGLPQFGFWDWVNDRLLTAPGGKYFGDKIVPALGSVAGYLIGGPLGAIGSGALIGAGGGAGEHNNPMIGALHGAAQGAGIGGLTALGALGLGKLGALGALGGAKGAGAAIGSAAANRAAAMTALKSVGAGAPSIAPQGFLGSLGSKAAGLWNDSSLLDKGLLGTAIIGSLFGKSSEPRPQPIFEENQKVLQHPGWRKDQMPSANVGILNRNINPVEIDPYQAGYIPEHQYFGNYADGGSVAQYYHGGAGGQDDNLDTHVKKGDFIWDADVASGLGDGNSIAGAHKLIHAAEKIGGSPAGLFQHLKPNARLSPGEVKWDESIVTRLGNGSNARGAKIAETIRENVRMHKRSAPSNKIPPKAKSISEYMLGGKY